MIPRLMNAAGSAKTVDRVKALAPDYSAVMMGSFSLLGRGGNPGNVDYHSSEITLNVRGIPSPPIDVWTQLVGEASNLLHRDNKECWVSVAGFTAEEFAVLGQRAVEAGADIVELNFGCPNMTDGMDFAPIISYRPELIRESLSLVEQVVSVKVGVKLSPIFDRPLMRDVDAAIVEAGNVGYVAAINTVPYCLVLRNGAPVISFGDGLAGMSGPVVKPIGLGQVAQHVTFLAGSDVAVVGVGGISSENDVADYLAVGAVGCQVNSVLIDA